MVDEAIKEDAELDQDNTILEPKESRGWLELLATADRIFDSWQTKSDSIDKLFANLENLANTTREREFQIFQANVAVLGPSVYSRPPIPVVTPRFKDRRPVARTSAEVLERTAVVTIEQQDINAVMLSLRDDLNTNARGVAWLRLGEKDKRPCVYVDHVARRDFRHDPTRTWRENDWVARGAWLTRGEARKRFYKTSKNLYRDAAYQKRKQDENGYDEQDTRLKAQFWELWSKSANLVVWVSEGCDKCLDYGPPHLELEGFFPCPPPCYGTLQRGTLIPVPDVLFYKDQLEEINEITGRIGALTEGLRVKGFYPAGAGQVADAIEAAMQDTNNNVKLVPVSNWAMLGTGTPKDMVMWWPLEQVAETIKVLIELRKQLIDDVYQITGLSDIMRGSTVASETLGAQELKSQYGSVRIRDRQNELVRIARDIIRIAAEIIAENYDQQTIVEMSQMDLPTAKDIKQQIGQLQQQGQQIEQQIAQAKQNPQIMAMAQQDPEKAQALEQQAQQQLQAITGQIEELGQTVTIDAVMKFLRDNRMRAFTLDIETDSTIQPNEDAAKKRATEFVTAMSSVLQQGTTAIAQTPEIAPLVGEIIDYTSKQFRVGRTMEQAIEGFVDQMKEMAKQPRPDPNAAQMQADQAKAQTDQQTAQLDSQNKQAQIASDEKVAIGKAQADAGTAQADIASKERIAVAQAEADKVKATQTSADVAVRAKTDLDKAFYGYLAQIEIAKIGAKADLRSTAFEAILEEQLGIRKHEQALELQDQQHQHNTEIVSMKPQPNGAAT